MPTPKVLFLLPYPVHHAPSQRFRVEQFLPALIKAGIRYRLAPFLDEPTWKVLYKPGHYGRKVGGVGLGFIRRLYTVFFIAPFYSHVFIHREAAPLGPPVFEWVLSKLLRKRVIYDFDDAIWIPNTTRENRLVGWVKSFSKIRKITGWSHAVAAGNAFLLSWAKQWNQRGVLLPTCVDVVNRHNTLKQQEGTSVTIGWTGSHSTMKYLDPLVPVLQAIGEKYDGKDGIKVDFLFISNRAPEFVLPRMQYLPWKEATEVADLLRLNIGLMPLEQDPWSEGKCGFKLIQYLAVGIPAVASPIGVNKDIIEAGTNGHLCATTAEWQQALVQLVEDAGLRKAMGEAGREKIVREYSVQAHEGRFLRLFT